LTASILTIIKIKKIKQTNSTIGVQHLRRFKRQKNKIFLGFKTVEVIKYRKTTKE
jgi:hypothetical protein